MTNIEYLLSEDFNENVVVSIQSKFACSTKIGSFFISYLNSDFHSVIEDLINKHTLFETRAFIMRVKNAIQTSNF